MRKLFMKSQRPKWSYLLHIYLIGIIEHDLKLNRPIVKSCASSAALCSPKTLSKNFSFTTELRKLEMAMAS